MGLLLAVFVCGFSLAGFYDNRDNRNNGLIVNSMLSVDNNKNNFYQPEGWLPLEPTFTFVALKAPKHTEQYLSERQYLVLLQLLSKYCLMMLIFKVLSYRQLSQ